MKDWTDNIVRDKRPQKRGWAPGHYVRECSCGAKFIGDKRAFACADCGYDDSKWLSDDEFTKNLDEMRSVIKSRLEATK